MTRTHDRVNELRTKAAFHIEKARKLLERAKWLESKHSDDLH